MRKVLPRIFRQSGPARQENLLVRVYFTCLSFGYSTRSSPIVDLQVALQVAADSINR